ncbi:MAG TPA: hypothetical protein VM368_04175 [Flavisolibacter sp.]|nr:hypothetical protein [Flavisolibacter sp.]
MNQGRENTSMNYQDHPHQEGAQNNIASGSGNNSQTMSDMLNESDEQKAGQAHGQKDDENVRQEERLP